MRTSNLFTAVCVLTLLQDLEGKSPEYIREKLWWLEKGDERIFKILDPQNQARVRRYFEKWGLEFPSEKEAE